MATIINRRIVTDKEEVDNVFEENSGEFIFTWKYKLFELLDNSSEICEWRNGKPRWFDARSDTSRFPDIERMSNLVVVGNKVYAWAGHRLWFLDMFGFTWRMVEIRGGMPAIRPLGATLRLLDEGDGDVIEHTMLYRERMLYVVRFRLSGSEYLPQTTVPHDDYPLKSWEIDNTLIETHRRLREEEEEKERRKKENIRQLRKEDEKSDVTPLVYSRKCELCRTENPLQRAVFTSCGHVSCLVCAIERANEDGLLDCPFCRKETGFIKAFEELR